MSIFKRTKPVATSQKTVTTRSVTTETSFSISFQELVDALKNNGLLPQAEVQNLTIMAESSTMSACYLRPNYGIYIRVRHESTQDIIDETPN